MFCIIFLCHIYLWEHRKKSSMKINQLTKYQDSFHEDSGKILLYQLLQILYRVSISPLPRGIQEIIWNEN